MVEQAEQAVVCTKPVSLAAHCMASYLAVAASRVVIRKTMMRPSAATSRADQKTGARC